MPLAPFIKTVLALALSGAATAAAAAPETVHFPSLDGATNLTAFLSRPADSPDLERRELPQYRSGDGPVPVEGTDEEARADSILRVLGYLKQHLE